MFTPPRVARFLLERLIPRPLREDMLADLAEGYQVRVSSYGVWRAWRWYWRQLFSPDWWQLHRELEPLLESSRRRTYLGDLMSSIAQDIRYAIRSFLRTPGFTAVVVLTLALGIGANVALVSVVHAVLMQPMPYADPERVVSLWSQWSAFPKTWISIPEYRTYRDTFESFDGVASYYESSANLTDQDLPERIGLAGVTPNLFDVTGVEPSIGRTFTEEEAEPRHE